MPVDMPEDDDEEEEDEEEQDKQMEQVEEKEELESKEEEESEFGESFEKTPFRHRSPLKPPPPKLAPKGRLKKNTRKPSSPNEDSEDELEWDPDTDGAEEGSASSEEIAPSKGGLGRAERAARRSAAKTLATKKKGGQILRKENKPIGKKGSWKGQTKKAQE